MTESRIDKDCVATRLRGLGLPNRHVDHAIESLPARACGVILYGSRARRDATDASDVDLLIIRSAHGRTMAMGAVNASTYSEHQFRAASGTLFGTHIARDGIVLHDTKGEIASALQDFKPADQLQVYGRVRSLAQILRSSERSNVQHADGLLRLARYLFRTALYAHALDPGPPCFSVAELSRRYAEPELIGLLSSRPDAVADPLALVLSLRGRIENIVGTVAENPFRSLEALIVGTWDEDHDLANAALLALSPTGQNLPYAEIPRVIL